MRAVIPVAGIGSRMRPHTFSVPKVLLNVAGKPILGHILDVIKQQEIKDVTIIRGYKGEEVEKYVHSAYPELNFDFVEQEEMLGLGHAILMGAPTFKSEPLLIILGDTIFDVDLSKAVNPDVSLLGVKKVEDPRRFGVVIKDEAGNITKLVEKPQEFISDLAIVGIYSIKNSDSLVDALNYIMDNKITTKNEYQLTDALQVMIDRGEKFESFNVEAWYDCGKPETLLTTNKHLLDKYQNKFNVEGSIIIDPVFISDTAKIENSVIGPYAAISDGVEIKNSIIKNSIVSFNSKVENALLKESIIGANADFKGVSTKINIGDSSSITNE
jgi:glucose-1-phosphate thymidylyltransferase